MQFTIYDKKMTYFALIFLRAPVLITLAKTKQLVKPVLPTKDTAVCVVLDSRVWNVKLVRFSRSLNTL